MGFHEKFTDPDGSCPRSKQATISTMPVHAPTCVQWELTELFAFISGALLLSSAFLVSTE